MTALTGGFLVVPLLTVLGVARLGKEYLLGENGSLELPAKLVGASGFALLVVVLTFVAVITVCAYLRLSDTGGARGLLTALKEETVRVLRVYVETAAFAAMGTLIVAVLALNAGDQQWPEYGEELLRVANLQLVVSLLAVAAVSPVVITASATNLLRDTTSGDEPWKMALGPPTVMALLLLVAVRFGSADWEAIVVAGAALVVALFCRVREEGGVKVVFDSFKRCLSRKRGGVVEPCADART